jgi:hypothetical protein
LEESLRESRPVLAVEVYEEGSLTSVFKVLHGLAAEKIMPVSTHAPIANSDGRLARRTASSLGRLPAFA